MPRAGRGRGTIAGPAPAPQRPLLRPSLWVAATLRPCSGWPWQSKAAALCSLGRSLETDGQGD